MTLRTQVWTIKKTFTSERERLEFEREGIITALHARWKTRKNQERLAEIDKRLKEIEKDGTPTTAVA